MPKYLKVELAAKTGSLFFFDFSRHEGTFEIQKKRLKSIQREPKIVRFSSEEFKKSLLLFQKAFETETEL